MRLNFDILAAVLPWIKTRRALLSYISTCSDLYNAGSLFLLKFHYNIVPSKLPQFYQFLQSRSPASFLALRSLYLSSLPYMFGILEEDAVGPLADIMGRAKNLRRIQVSGDVFERCPLLYEALGSLQHLRCLDLHDAYSTDPEQLDLLTRLHSPLTTLKLGGMDDDFDIIVALSNFRRTLKELQLEEATLCYSPEVVCYPALTNLHLTVVCNPRLSFLIPAFPHLLTLNISFSGKFDHEAENARNANLQFQTDHPSQRWYLEYLMGDTGSLYVLALQSGVPDVTLTYFTPETDVATADICLTPLCPIQLSFNNDVADIVGTDWLSEAISSDWFELVSLDITFTLDMLWDHQVYLDNIFEELSIVSTSKPDLFLLDLELYAWGSRSEPNSTHEFLDSLEMDAIATCALQAIPTLQTAKFSIYSNETRVSHWAYGEDGGIRPILSKDEVNDVYDRVMSPLFDGQSFDDVTHDFRADRPTARSLS
ncbi:hypothetical protein EIP86_010693 [Pleurotus ostreatoroseus]|nr:hypothetical protein EIP86_010693 [Pleurotus ostreatoroseus]